ncbi:hypothetical protein [Bartonella grahamii]|uniref:hypothetical protein n=1 Tax=Bartonella grahamii TaxID=33045 RepID=UPI0023617C9A|nr:hypothetical protein [Bartonella grahamii]
MSGLGGMVSALVTSQAKRRGAQWIYRYTIHDFRREIGSGTLKDIPLMINIKQWISVEIL